MNEPDQYCGSDKSEWQNEFFLGSEKSSYPEIFNYELQTGPARPLLSGE